MYKFNKEPLLMGTHIGIGFSQEIDTQLATQQAAAQSRANLPPGKIDIAIVFSTTHYNPQEIALELHSSFRETKIIGCSTAGIILPNAVKTRGISVLSIQSDSMFFGAGAVNNLNKTDTHKAGNLLARETLANFGRHSRQTFLFFIDGQTVNNSSFLKGLQEILGNVFPILGAGSCDNFKFSNTFQIFENNALSQSATGLLIGGHATIGVGCRHGWSPLGKPRTIDNVQGNIIKIINGKAAYELYREYFEEESENLRSNQLDKMSILYPLGIFVEGSQEYLLRNAVEILEDGSIVCQGDIPEGGEVHIMIGNKDSCQQAAIQAAEESEKALAGKKAKLVIVLESMTRLKLLGRLASEEITEISRVFGTDVPLIGMYTNGEIGPFQTIEKFKKPYLLNESIIVLAIA